MSGLILASASLALWLVVLALPWRPWSTREVIEPRPRPQTPDLSEVTALIPARDEAAFIGASVQALLAQGSGLRVIVIDDQSSDGTAAAVPSDEGQRVEVLPGSARPPGWSGKLWALEQGLQRLRSPLLLLLDADIVLHPGMVAALRETMDETQAGLVSVMAQLRMQGLWERALLPAFVYFFKLLYPFALANSPRSRVAAAGGGCMLLRADALRASGGFAAISDSLIDDCALARLIKTAGWRCRVALTHGARSRRACPDLGTIWDMIARTAFTELRYSALRLALCTLLMAIAFWAPLASVLLAAPGARWLALGALLAMGLSYLPTLAFYRRSALWTLTLPLIATLFLAMTWSSALRYWRGERSRWKGRLYRRV